MGCYSNIKKLLCIYGACNEEYNFEYIVNNIIKLFYNDRIKKTEIKFILNKCSKLKITGLR